MIPYTIFIDIDGTLLEHPGNLANVQPNQPLLNGAQEKFAQWRSEGHQIIITTARPECMRELTHNQLLGNGLIYDQLIMGLTHGKRYLINDSKIPFDETNSYSFYDKTATGITVERNKGLGGVDFGIYRL